MLMRSAWPTEGSPYCSQQRDATVRTGRWVFLAPAKRRSHANGEALFVPKPQLQLWETEPNGAIY